MADTTVEFFRGDLLSGPGWIPDHPGFDDKVYSVPMANWPSSIHLQTMYPTCFQPQVEDQWQTSSCSGQASTTLAEFMFARKTGRLLNFARMLTYWGARAYRGWQNRDSGSVIADNLKWMSEKGLALESFHQFRMENLHKEPSREVLEQAARHRVTDAVRVPRTGVLAAIASGYPVVGGFTCYRDPVFGEVARQTGYVRLPKSGDVPNGGHAVCFTWYDERLGLIGGPNSWGVNWGANNRVRPGWFELPLDYIYNANLSDDFWTATTVVV